MSMYDDGPVHEPFGPEYVRPKNADCPDCDCCTAALCAKGRASISECSGHVDDAELLERVTGCPCSAESTRGTLSWRAAMIRAVTFATEKPLRPELESLLTRISEDEPYADAAALLPKLTVRRYVQWRPGLEPVVTDFGRAYINARWGLPRQVTSLVVQSVDPEARTAQAVVTAFSVDQLVTVPMDQVLNTRTGLTVDAFGDTLHAEVNADARDAGEVVLTKVSNPAMAVTARPGSPDGAR
ncbi:hypothetical protein ACIOHS_26785 [Streptomyces sp. NPDC088253]|uniref:hypothetical protein n=1 Tax=Streptomyces sp. NPDC088253 TaxID=3365846 RepID=UPI00381D9013